MNIPQDLSAYLFLQSIVLVMVYIFMYKVLDFRFFVINVIQWFHNSCLEKPIDDEPHNLPFMCKMCLKEVS